MAKKITIQMLAEKLAVSAGVDKETAEAFLKAFPEVLLASVAQDRLVELDTFGKFYLVAVADRGSVDVNTGAHIVIPGYDKLTFSVDDSIVGQFNDAQPKVKEKAAPAPVAKKPKPVKETKAEPETQPDIKPEPKAAESVKEESTKEESTIVEPAPIVDPTPVVESVPVVEPAPIPTVSQPTPTDKGVVPDAQMVTEGVVAKFFRNLPWWGYVTMVAVLFLIVLFVVLDLSGDSGEDGADEQTGVASEQVDEQSGADTKESKPVEKQKVHVLKYGESLTTISVQYYGTPDSMGAIWRLNKFTDPNNIPLGTTIKLP